MKYIDINKSQIPYQFELNIKDEVFQFVVLYNSVGDYFTLNLYKDHKEVIFGEKIVYGVPVFENFSYLPIPKITIKPYDTTGKTDRITFENLSEDVFLYVLDSAD